MESVPSGQAGAACVLAQPKGAILPALCGCDTGGWGGTIMHNVKACNVQVNFCVCHICVGKLVS